MVSYKKKDDKNMRILLVEDEQIVAQYLKSSVKKSGHEVDYAPDGNIGHEKALSKGYDVIILDIILPYMSGLEICKATREAGIETPIIILSSMESEKSRVKGLDVGADDYMIKPFSYPELEARLRALYRRPRQIITDELKINDISVNLDLREIKVDGKTIELRAKEFDLLVYLMRNSERVIPREELFNNVWGVNFENASNRVDSAIKEIRRKIGKDKIKTVTKSGYKIIK